jgi:hypothetical protein
MEFANRNTRRDVLNVWCTHRNKREKTKFVGDLLGLWAGDMVIRRCDGIGCEKHRTKSQRIEERSKRVYNLVPQGISIRRTRREHLGYS